MPLWGRSSSKRDRDAERAGKGDDPGGSVGGAAHDGGERSDPGRCPDYLRPYRDAARATGAGFESLLWHSRAYQQVRFQVLLESVRASISAGHATRRDPLGGRVVVDLGCGRADLAAYLVQERVEIGRYIGVEAVAELAEESRRTIAAIPEPRPDALVIEADFAADQAVVERLACSGGEVFILSGSLNTMTQDLAQSVLERAWRSIARVRRGVLAFNFLSNLFRCASLSTPLGAAPRTRDPGPDFDGPARRFDTQALIAWALGRSGSVIVRHDYLGGRDCTIVMGAEG